MQPKALRGKEARMASHLKVFSGRQEGFSRLSLYLSQTRSITVISLETHIHLTSGTAHFALLSGVYFAPSESCTAANLLGGKPSA